MKHAGPRQNLLSIFNAAVAAVAGDVAVRRYLESAQLRGLVALVAIGKAAQAMTLGAHEVLGDRIAQSLVVSKTGHLDFQRLAKLNIHGLETSHPLPDTRSLEAGRQLEGFLSRLPDACQLLFLISGGASSLIEYLPPGIGLKQLQQANQWLLGSGLDITEMNLVRKSLSLIKAGGAIHWLGGHDVCALEISDVPGDDPAVIGSGLLSPDPSLTQRVRQLPLPDWLKALVEQGMQYRRIATKPDNLEIHVIARLADAMQAAAQTGREMGYSVCPENTFQSGDAGDKGRELAHRLRAAGSVLHVWGGETTVSLPEPPGRGGRNQHLALAAAIELAGDDRCCFLSAGTDGTDGPGSDAGALVDGGTVARGAIAGLDALECLRRADSGTLLAASGDLIHTGPTGTNVMDLMLGLKQES